MSGGAGGAMILLHGVQSNLILSKRKSKTNTKKKRERKSGKLKYECELEWPSP